MLLSFKVGYEQKITCINVLNTKPIFMQAVTTTIQLTEKISSLVTVEHGKKYADRTARVIYAHVEERYR